MVFDIVFLVSEFGCIIQYFGLGVVYFLRRCFRLLKCFSKVFIVLSCVLCLSSNRPSPPHSWVYAVEFSHRSGRDLVEMSKKRPNIVPIVEDARYPLKYRMLVPMVDCIFMDVAQPDQVCCCTARLPLLLTVEECFLIFCGG